MPTRMLLWTKTCTAMKPAGVEIFAISCSDAADRANLESRASDPKHFFVAGPSTISKVYQSIALRIGHANIRLTQ